MDHNLAEFPGKCSWRARGFVILGGLSPSLLVLFSLWIHYLALIPLLRGRRENRKVKNLA
jgi:hypothetical protein